MGNIRKNICLPFVIIVSKSVVSSRVNICVKVFARDMCSHGINFASGLFLLANLSSERVLHLVASTIVCLVDWPNSSKNN